MRILALESLALLPFHLCLFFYGCIEGLVEMHAEITLIVVWPA